MHPSGAIAISERNLTSRPRSGPDSSDDPNHEADGTEMRLLIEEDDLENKVVD